MRIAFFDLIDWDYTIDTAYERPLGGSQSALCYLAEALAAAGHEVLLLNRARVERTIRGVRCLPVGKADRRLLRSLDCAIVLNTVEQGAQLKPKLSAETPLILWMQHADDQPAAVLLAREQIRECYDRFVFVSRWQREQFIARFKLPVNRCTTLRNAVGPCYAELLPTDAPLPSDKLWPPKLVYTSTPFRGLDLLLAGFPAIRQAVPEATLDVFSSLQVYQATATEDAARFGALYEQCRAMDGVTYLGSVPQPELAEHLWRATLLAYPNHFAETSCIAVMEALAAGCRVISSELGALPETSQGFARLIPVEDDWTAYLHRFVATTIAELHALRDDPQDCEQRFRQQIATVRQSTNWQIRAEQWATWLSVQCESISITRRKVS